MLTFTKVKRYTYVCLFCGAVGFGTLSGSLPPVHPGGKCPYQPPGHMGPSHVLCVEEEDFAEDHDAGHRPHPEPLPRAPTILTTATGSATASTSTST